MKLVKSLLLSSAAGICAVASAQAADLPFRKAAPVEYVRVCDYTGAGYFYIPGTDTCLKVGGYVRAEYAYVDQNRAYKKLAGKVATYAPTRLREASGFKVEGRVDVDTRTQTAYGTLRTYVRMQFDQLGGSYSPAGKTTSAAYIDKAFVQFAGFTAGRVQSFFDFYADNYNFEGIANSDASSQVFAYTATFGGGFSATIAAEDRDARKAGVLGTINLAGNTTNVAYDGETIPDFVAAIRLDQAWGSAQLSAAYHEVSTTVFQSGTPANGSASVDGFAVQAGVQIKLPMLAAGDDIWLQGAYQQGAFSYQDQAGSLSGGINAVGMGGFYHNDGDAIAIANAGGGYTLAKAEGFSVAGAFHHYFSPNFSDILFGSYEEVSYGNRAKNTSWFRGGVADASEYRIGNDFVWTPVNNLSIGIEVIYAHIDQKIAQDPANFVALPVGIKKDPSAFEGRFRVERDF